MTLLVVEIGIRIVIIDTETITIGATVTATDAGVIVVVIEIRGATTLKDEKIRTSIGIKDLGRTLAWIKPGLLSVLKPISRHIAGPWIQPVRSISLYLGSPSSSILSSQRAMPPP